MNHFVLDNKTVMEVQAPANDLNGDLPIRPFSKVFNHIGAEIDGSPTDFVWANFSNCLFLAVTQYKKIGTLTSVEIDEFVPALEDNTSSYDINILLGSSKVETLLAARYLSENLKIKKPLYLFCDLKDYNVEQLKAVKDVFIDVLNV